MDAAGSSTYCFNCMIMLYGHIVEVTESLYYVHIKNINKWPKNENYACKVGISRAEHAHALSILPVVSASCPVHELSSPRVDQSASHPVRKLAYLRVVQ